MEELGPKDLVVNHWAVAFLDVLGQRAALKKMDFLPDVREEARLGHGSSFIPVHSPSAS
jgi:hypothetical protein